jgi:hypothetical protein
MSKAEIVKAVQEVFGKLLVEQEERSRRHLKDVRAAYTQLDTELHTLARRVYILEINIKNAAQKLLQEGQ